MCADLPSPSLAPQHLLRVSTQTLYSESLSPSPHVQELTYLDSYISDLVTVSLVSPESFFLDQGCPRSTYRNVLDWRSLQDQWKHPALQIVNRLLSKCERGSNCFTHPSGPLSSTFSYLADQSITPLSQTSSELCWPLRWKF